MFRYRELFYRYLQSLLLHLLLYTITKTLSSIQHTTVAHYSAVLHTHRLPLLFLLLLFLVHCLMIPKFIPTSTGPTRPKSFTVTLTTSFLIHIMFLVRMFAIALKVLRTMDWNIHEVNTFTTRLLTFNFPIRSLKVVMTFIRMVAETFR